VAALFAESEALAGFGFCDREGVQARFVEVQVWEREGLLLAQQAAPLQGRRRTLERP
jgi:hypothetical protein